MKVFCVYIVFELKRFKLNSKLFFFLILAFWTKCFCYRVKTQCWNLWQTQGSIWNLHSLYLLVEYSSSDLAYPEKQRYVEKLLTNTSARYEGSSTTSNYLLHLIYKDLFWFVLCLESIWFYPAFADMYWRRRRGARNPFPAPPWIGFIHNYYHFNNFKLYTIETITHVWTQKNMFALKF